MIAHRLATVRHADLVAVIRDGGVVELGPPAELLAGDTIFAELARTQALLGEPPRERPRRVTQAAHRRRS